MLTNPKSLAGTLANLNHVLLQGEKLSSAQREDVAAWIASRVGVPGSYAGLPAPTPTDYSSPVKLFTGETVRSGAGKGCKLGFEATWALTALQPKRAASVAAAKSCREIATRLFARETRRPGIFCCYSCGVAGWRALGVAPGREPGQWLARAMALLRADRDGKGRWQRFPFWYTVLALHDLERADGLAELRYAAPALERAVTGGRDKIGQRRRLLAERALARI